MRGFFSGDIGPVVAKHELYKVPYTMEPRTRSLPEALLGVSSVRVGLTQLGLLLLTLDCQGAPPISHCGDHLPRGQQSLFASPTR